MSLIYRLPLTNNLNSYGLYNGINYGHNLANQSDGKVGKCYSFGKTTTLAALTDSSGNFITNSQGQIIEVTNSNSSKVNSYIDIETDVAKQLSSDFSFSLWLRIDGWNTSYETYVYGGVGSSPWANYIFGLLRDSTNSTITFVISNGTTSTTTSCTSGTLTTGNWYHITCTYTSGMMRMYVDGTQVKEYATTIAPDFTKIRAFHLGALNSTTYQTNCSMNDFRIYDHCLSPMEVKELAKGLVLHYPLNRGGWGQENLFNWSNNATGIILYDYQNKGSFTQFTNSLTFDPSTTVGKKYTISFWAKSPNGTTPLYLYNTNSNPKYFYFSTTLTSSLGTEWQFFKYTVTNTQYSGSGTASTNTNIWKRIEIYAPNQMKVQVKQIKVEEGEIATPWCPNSSDTLATAMGLNSTTEYDCSGFCNNGTWHGTHTNTSDTPKYAVSTTATGSGTTYLEGPVLPAEAKTVALWIKNTNKSSNGAIFNDKTTGLQIGLLNSLLYMNSKASTAGFTTTHWVNGEWNHVVAVNNNGTRSLYVNGQAETQSGASNYYIHNADNCWLWNRSYNNNYPFTGSLCDLRVYATALSADDVKSLYQNSAYIDSSGNVYGAVHSEV